MAKVVLRIKTNEGVDVFSGFTTVNETNNVSQSVEQWELVTENNGTNGKSLAKPLSLRDGFLGGKTTKLMSEKNKYNGFMFGATDIDARYNLHLTIYGKKIDKIVFLGDKNANQFPVEAIIDKDTENQKTIYSDDPTWVVAFEKESDSHTIEFTRWNRAYYNACLTTIKVLDKHLSLNKAWLKSLESVSQSTSDPNTIFYGVLPNTGNAVIYDNNGELLDFVNEKIISNNRTEVNLLVNDNNIQSHNILDSDYNIVDKTIEFQLSNDLQSWNDTYYNGYYYPGARTSAYSMLFSVLKSADKDITLAKFDKMLSNYYDFGITIKEYLENLIIDYPYLKSDTITNTINKFCLLAQINLYKNNNNELEFVSSRPRIFDLDTNSAIKIETKNQYSELKYSPITKNTYDNVDLLEKSVNDTLDTNANVFNYENYENYNWFEKDYAAVLYGDLNDAVFARRYARVETYYAKGKISFPKKSNYNLTEIKDVYPYTSGNDEQNNISISVDYELISVDSYVSADENFINNSYNDFYDISNKDSQFDILKYVPDAKVSFGSGKLEVPKLTVKSGLHSDSTKLEDKTSFVITDKGDYYEIDYNVLYGTFEGKYAYGDKYEQGTFKYASEFKNIKKYIGKKLKISFKGQKKEIVFEDSPELESQQNYINTKKSTGLQNNELLTPFTTFNSQKVLTIIKDNIKKDYFRGSAFGEITIACADYYNEKNEKVKNWANGEIINVGEFVIIDKDNEGNPVKASGTSSLPALWKVIGRKFRNDGVPLVDLQLQEVISSYIVKISPFVKFFSDNVLYESTVEISQNKEITIFSNDRIGYTKKLLLNGVEIKDGDSYFVKDDIVINAVYTPIVYTITYNLDGGENSSKNKTEYTIESDFYIHEATNKEGYIFDGWIDENGNYVTEIVPGTTGNITLTAQWTPTTYLLFYNWEDGILNPALGPVRYPGPEEFEYEQEFGLEHLYNPNNFIKLDSNGSVTHYGIGWNIDGEEIIDPNYYTTWKWGENKEATIIWTQVN